MPEKDKKHSPDSNNAAGVFNTAENAMRAAASARAALAKVEPGKVWNHIAPAVSAKSKEL